MLIEFSLLKIKKRAIIIIMMMMMMTMMKLNVLTYQTLPIVMVDFLGDNRAFVSHLKGLVNCMPFALKSETIGKLSLMTFYLHIAKLANFYSFGILKQSHNMCVSDHQAQR